MKIIILGCGRVGATLARALEKAGHTVAVIDSSSDSFERLGPKFQGTTVIGNGTDEDVLKRAGIQSANAFVAVTNGDNRNIMASQIAREIFHVEQVICRIYDPIRDSTYKKLGLQTFCPTTLGANMLFNTLTGVSAKSSIPAETSPTSTQSARN